MKILYIGHTYTVRANHAKIAALAREPGVEIVLVTPPRWRGPLYNNTTDVFDASVAPNVVHKIVPAYFIGKESGYFYGLALFRIVRQFQPDIIHVEQGAYALSYAQTLLAAQLFSPRSKSLFFTWWNLPYRLRGVKWMAERFNFTRSDVAIVGNNAARAIVQAHGFNGSIHILPQLGIDYTATNRTRNDEDIFTIGYAGRITKEKGVLDLIEAAARMQSKESARLYFIGYGDALDESKRLAAYHGITFLHHAPVRNDELPEHLAKMDVLILPSRTTPQWVEQFGHILLEAMAAGVPVVGSSSGEIPNVIGDAGYVFPEGDVEGLAAQLDILAVNQEEWQRLSQAGMLRVSRHFTNDIIAKKQIEIYRSVLAP
ncbi:MAG TPA: glycosyltransferase [Candidatus Kapabacteria bacterium]|nr:glycosyltransferase [Candidatus Kapabacteria bacterium]